MIQFHPMLTHLARAIQSGAGMQMTNPLNDKSAPVLERHAVIVWKTFQRVLKCWCSACDPSRQCSLMPKQVQRFYAPTNALLLQSSTTFHSF